MVTAPAFFASASARYGPGGLPGLRVANRLEKSMPPTTSPIGGMITSSTRLLTIVPNAPPTITPTAMSMTLPRTANSLNSLNTGSPHLIVFAPDRPRQPSCIVVEPDRAGRVKFHDQHDLSKM